MCGNLSNPLLVVPLQKAAQTDFLTAKKSAEAEPQSNIVGAGLQAYEDAVMQRLLQVFFYAPQVLADSFVCVFFSQELSYFTLFNRRLWTRKSEGFKPHDQEQSSFKTKVIKNKALLHD